MVLSYREVVGTCRTRWLNSGERAASLHVRRLSGNKGIAVLRNGLQMQPNEIEVGLLTGGGDRPYAFGLATALVSMGVRLDFVGSDHLDIPELRAHPAITFLNLRGDQREDSPLRRKIWRVLTFYVRLIRYARMARPKLLHILWNNKFELLDRTVLMLYYKCLGKKILLTAHNVNARKRDANDSPLNRFTLRIQYLLADHIFVHTEKMKSELVEEFGVRGQAVSVIPFGINNSVPVTDLTPEQARQRLGVANGEKTILFFGRIGPYKGLEFLVAAFQQIAMSNAQYRLIIVGEPKKGSEPYLRDIQQTIEKDPSRERVIQKIAFIPDSDTELYFKAADVLVLPYTQVFQSGVLFLGYSFGLPVIAADVGSFREDIIEGKTGYLCQSCNAADLASAIGTYFESDLYKDLARQKQEIQSHAKARHSWDAVGKKIRHAYEELLRT